MKQNEQFIRVAEGNGFFHYQRVNNGCYND